MSNLKTIYYYPELREEIGSINAVIVMGYLENCFDEKGACFYKFMEPCNHRDYVKGESCVEELGMTAAEFRTAFKYIGVVYKSKKAFNLSKDKFQGKMYLSYYDRISKLTYYMRNDEIMNGIREEMDKADDSCNNETEINAQEASEVEEEIGVQEISEDETEMNTQEVSEVEEEMGAQEVSEGGKVAEGREAASKEDEGIEEQEVNQAEEKAVENQEVQVQEESMMIYRNEEYVDAVNQKSGNGIYNMINNKSCFISLDMSHNIDNKDNKSKDLRLDTEHNDNKSKDLRLDTEHNDTKTKDLELGVNQDHINRDDIFQNHALQNHTPQNDTGSEALMGDVSDNLSEMKAIESSTAAEVPYDAIKELFNQICKSFDRIVEWTNWQKQKLEDIWVKYERDLETFRIAFEQLEDSDFLCGRKKAWKAYLGWILKPYHFADILMGKYRNYKKAVNEVKDAYVEIESHEWDFDEIERLERQRIDRILRERGYAL